MLPTARMTGTEGTCFQVISVGGISNQTRDIAENPAAGADVGAAVTGRPYGTETLFYTLTGEAATSGLFEIDSSTGQISVAEGASLDHEATKNSYTGKVKWTVNGQAAEVNLTINVTDEDEPPLAPVNPQVTSITDTGFTVTWEVPGQHRASRHHGVQARSPGADHAKYQRHDLLRELQLAGSRNDL